MTLIVRESVERGTVKGFGDPDFIERPATVEDIRQAVESGTIKGEVVEVTGDEIETDPVWLEQGQWLCIRLDKERPSDGGSETDA